MDMSTSTTKNTKKTASSCDFEMSLLWWACILPWDCDSLFDVVSAFTTQPQMLFLALIRQIVLLKD